MWYVPLMSHQKKSWPTLKVQRIILLYPSKRFSVLALKFMSMTYLELISMCDLRDLTYSFICKYPVAPKPFVEKNFLPLSYFDNLAKNKLVINVTFLFSSIF